MRFSLILTVLLVPITNLHALAQDCVDNEERVIVTGPNPTHPPDEITTTTERCYCGAWYVVKVEQDKYLQCGDDPFSSELIEDAVVITYDYQILNNLCTWGGPLACVVLEEVKTTSTKKKTYLEYYTNCSARSPRLTSKCPLDTETETITKTYDTHQLAYGYTFYWLSTETFDDLRIYYSPTYCGFLVSGWEREESPFSNTLNFPNPIGFPFCSPTV